MKLKKAKPVVAIDRHTFRVGMTKYFALQLALIAAFLGIMYSDLGDHQHVSYILGGLVFIFGMISIFLVKSSDYAGRFKDIYPEYELKNGMLFCIAFFPLIYFPLIIFLCFKEKASPKPPLKIFTKFSIFSLIALPMLILLLSSPKIAYWVANPSTFYISDILHSSEEILLQKDQLDKSQVYVSAVDQYTEKNPGKLNSTELVLLTAVASSNVLKKKQTEESADDIRKIENNVNYSILLLKETNKLIALGEKSKFGVTDYSLLQWLHASGVIEIILLTIINQEIENKFNTTLVNTTMGIVQNLENGMVKLPAETQAFYRPDITKIKAEIMNSKTYKTSQK